MNGKLKWRHEAFHVEWRKKGKASQRTVDLSEIEPDAANEAIEGGGLVEVEFDLVHGNPACVRKPASAWRPAPPPEPARHAAQAAPEIPVNSPRVEHVDVPGRRLTLNNGAQPGTGDLSIAEWKVVPKGAPVGRDPGPGHFTGKWRRIDYYSGRPRCYPYNFARAPKNPAPEAATATGTGASEHTRSLLDVHPEMHLGRYRADCHTGWLDIEACTLSPLVISHPIYASGLLGDDDRKMLTDVFEKALQGVAYGPTEIERNNITSRDKLSQRIRPSAQAAPGKFVIPATSLKGMLRSYLEAYSHSFMPTLSEKLQGLEDDGKAMIRSRTNWRCIEAGLTREQTTLYTYRFGKNTPNGKTWQDWVPKGSTPWDKLAHVNQKANPHTWSLACRMFGRVAREHAQGPSWSGRIRVGELQAWDADGQPAAFADSEYWWLRPLIRPNGAKAKCEALYLLPNGNSVAEYDDPNSEARGLKFYWPHSLGGPGQTGALSLAAAGKLALSGPEAARDDNALRAAVAAMRVRVGGHKDHQPSAKSWLRPVLPGARFTGRIHFQNLTPIELGALLKAIELDNAPGAEFKDMQHTHRIGRAKPLGFGSILLRVQACALLNTKEAYTKLGPLSSSLQPEEEADEALASARSDFAAWCRPWKTPVWDDLAELSRIPNALTDYDYWKNWTDYQRGSAKPLETAS